MFTAAVIAKCVSIGESLNKTHTMRYHPATKMNKSMTHATWVNLKIIMLNEDQKLSMYYVSPLT